MSGYKLLVVAAALGLALPVCAQPDEPGRGVVRISLLNGDVSIRRGDSGDYIAAAVNAPLVVQDHVLTGSGSRAELQFDWANFLRLSHDADVRLAELGSRRYLVQLARGTVTWRVLRDSEAYIEISTPSVSVRPSRRGVYRVTVREDGSSEITVRSGEAEVYTPRGSERLRSGRTMFARGSGGDPEFRIGAEIPDDDWDSWNSARDRDLERSRSYQYLSRDIYGAEDLDWHGTWVYAGGYGWVWNPRVAVGWAPYRYGRWTWLDWYGWSWVSHDPWGWAPYHYGRWFWHAPVGWCWWPGAVGVRHHWSPGIVAFVGFGGAGVSVGFGWGRVGWIPLGPYEPFHPWWGNRWYGGYRNRTYIDNSVTVVRNVNITNVYRNSRIDNAVTVVDQDGFRRGRFNDTIRVSTDEIRGASLARGPVPVAPERESLRVADRETSLRGVERSGAERFFSRSRPAEVNRVSFEDQRRGIEQIARRSFADESMRSPADGGTRAASGRSVVDAPRDAGAVAETSAPARTAEQRGWRRLDEPPRSATPERAIDRTVQRSNVERGNVEQGNVERGSDSDWRRFGSPRVAEGSDAIRSMGSGRGSAETATGRTMDTPSGRSNVDRGPDNEWRRFGSPRVEGTDATRAAGAGERGAPRGRSASGDDFQRFGSGRVGEGSSRNFDSTDRSGSFNGWRWLSDRPETSDRIRGSGRDLNSSPGRNPESSDRGAGRSFDTPRMERQDSSTSRNADRGESIRISPPIVRERSDSGRSAPGGVDWGSRGGGRSFEGPRGTPGGSGGVRGGSGMRAGGDGGARSGPSGGGGRGGGGSRGR